MKWVDTLGSSLNQVHDVLGVVLVKPKQCVPTLKEVLSKSAKGVIAQPFYMPSVKRLDFLPAP